MAFLANLFHAGIAQASYTPPPNNRVTLNFNYDWKFIKQDVSGASAISFDDSSWQSVSLPHTWNDDKFREWIFNSNDSNGDPLNPAGTYYGLAWYRKHFTIDAADTGRKVILEFQGIGRVANFYVNGVWVGLHENGVAPYGLDITTNLLFGADNVIAVQVNNNENYQTVNYHGAGLPYGQPFNPNFGGLNRDVTLHISDKLYHTLPLYRDLGTVGTYIYATNIVTSNQTATVTCQVEVKNDYSVPQTVNCDAVVVDMASNVVMTLSAGQQTIAAGEKLTFSASGTMTNIHFWYPQFPYLYRVFTILSTNGTPVDVYENPLGVRQVLFSPTSGLLINGYPIYLKGFAPRCSMEWPCVGVPVDWLNDYDFQLMKNCNANFVRPMHIAPRKAMVEAADKFGLVMVCPAANNEGDDTDTNIWQERLDIMRDVTIYFRNNPSVLFYEGCNQILTAQHMTDMKNIRLTWDPNGGRFAGLRSNDSDVTQGIREYSCTMDGAEHQLYTPLWDAEYARAEGPRRVWDNYTPMLNPRATNLATKYITGGYFYIASAYHQAFGLNSGIGDFIGDYLFPIVTTNGTTSAYFRVQNSEDMVLENLAKYYGRYHFSAFAQNTNTSASQGVMVGGAKIIWADSVTDGRMHDMEVTRTSGAVDGARLPKEVYYGLQVAHSTSPQVYVVGHWNYPTNTVKTVYVVGNTPQVGLRTYTSGGTLIQDYGLGATNFFPASILPPGGDQVNCYVFAFTNVAWQPGIITATGYSNSVAVATHSKQTTGPAVALRLTPTVGPSGQFFADGSDIAMFDVEVLDASGNRCLTYEDTVNFSCSGAGVFLGGYNSGKRYSTNLRNLTNGYSLNLECGINRVFVRSTRTAGTFTLTVSGTNGLSSATASVSSTAFAVTNGLTSVWPQKYSVTLGAEPPPIATPTIVPPPPPAALPAPTTNIVDFGYSGGNQGAMVLTNAQPGMQVYVDSPVTFGSLPGYLIGANYIQPYLSDAGETAATDQYQFNIVRYSFIYLVIDAANGMPLNDNNGGYEWQKLPDVVIVNGRPMNVFKSRLMAPYENGYFADNGYGASPFDPNSNMYLVFVASVEQPLQSPSQTVTASSYQTPNTPQNGFDGNTSTRWSAADGTFPQWITVDLGQQCLLGGYAINWFNATNRSYQYTVQVSSDGTNFSMSLDMRANSAQNASEYRVPSVGASSGRWVKVTVLSAGGWASFNNMVINGVPAAAPAAPSGVNAIPGNSQIQLTWTAPAGAVSYNVMRSTIPGSETTLTNITSTSFTDLNLTNGTTYYYVVSSVGPIGEGTNSTEVSAVPTVVAVPPAPTGLTATVGSSQINLVWIAAAGAISYDVKRSTTAGAEVVISNVTATSFTDVNVTNGTVYFYEVSGVNSGGQGPNSTEVSVAPLAPGVAGPYQLRIPLNDAGPGTATASDTSGGAANISLMMLDSNGVAADYHGVSGSGPAGGTTRAMDFTTGSFSGAGPVAVTNSSALAFGTIPTWTLTYWFKQSQTGSFPSGYPPRIFALGMDASGTTDAGVANAIEMRLADASDFYVFPGTNKITVPYAQVANKWQFCALTYDGANFGMYLGSDTASATLVTNVALACGAMSFTGTPYVYLGNRADRMRALAGWMSDFRFYTNSGNAAFVEAVRQANAPAPSAPANVTVTNFGGSVLLSWTAQPNAVSYNVKRSTTSGLETTLTNITVTGFTDLNVTNGATYFYVITAVGSAGESAPSGEVHTTVAVGLTPYQLWQIQYFGSTNNPLAATNADASGSGQNNLFKYTAGLNPTNPASVFVLQMMGMSNGPMLGFGPVASNRIYNLQWRTDLWAGSWSTLTGIVGPATNSNQMIITDTNVVAAAKYYRVRITMP